MKRIPVKLQGNSYDVLIGAGLLKRAGSELRRNLPSPGSQVFVVTSPNVRRHWGEQLEQTLTREKLTYHLLEMKDGEPAKRLETIERLAEQMVRTGADRKTLLVAFGGGVVGDCVGFLASIFMRGIPVVQIPTTVQAQADASIGGKTGVNLSVGKNLVGTFHQPRAVLVDPTILETLNEREFRAGLFESLRCGVIRDSKLFEFMARQPEKILAHDRKALERVIVDSVRVKASVVAADERESGLRRILNFGHTIGHALEAATGYTQLLHGEAVAWGMLAATAIARSAGFCGAHTAEQIVNGIAAYGRPPRVSVPPDEVMELIKSDKKSVAGRVHWVLPERVGQVIITSDVPEPAVRSAIQEILCSS
ncbi:MAG TPA: 3-dehydroquinate synthase [Candidatus Angelobacter sp.]|nr:3-dehydroquinate synthase [Candidatus Angelobacter sp.]